MAMGSKRLAEVEALYRRDFHLFLGVASGITGSSQVAYDVVQDSFARAIEKLDSYRGDGELAAWVWRIVVNRAHTASTSNRDSRLGSVSPAEVVLCIDDTATESAYVGRLALAIKHLSPRQQEVIFLRYWADLDYRSIAGVLGVEIGTVSATLGAAYRMLRRSLQEVPAK